jgi:hypothetical protein
VNGKRVGSVQDVISAITQSRQAGDIKVQCTFAMISYHGLHPVTGNMMLYYDQLNVIAQHLQVAYPKQGDSACIPPAPNIRQVQAQTNTPNTEDLGKTFTLKELRKRQDWQEWRKARYKMLDSYHEQGMFSEPMLAPANSNIHHMLWRYVLKMCGTRKARMVCDGSPRQGTITLGHTFANILDAPSERLF